VIFRLYCMGMLRKKILNVPYSKQDTSFSCGAASLQMILRYFGIVKSEKDLADKFHTNSKSGTSHEAIIKAVKDEGLYYYVNNEAELEEISAFINRGLPVVVNFIELSQNEGHYAVVISIERGYVILNDPWNGENFRMTAESFIERWTNSKNRSKQWFLAASKENIKFGKIYRP